MRAVTWQGKRKVTVETVPDPVIEEPTDAIIKVTSTNICGSDLHLYEVLGAFMTPGDVLGHEAMGVVEEVGSEVGDLQVGDRVVIPFNISCGHCFMCGAGPAKPSARRPRIREQGTGAALFGYSKLYGEVPGGQAEYLRVPQAQYTHIKVPDGRPRRTVSSTCPTCCRPPGRRWSTRTCRGRHAGGPRPGPDRRRWRAGSRTTAGTAGSSVSTSSPSGCSERGSMCSDVIDLDEHDDDLGDVVRESTDGRGADAVIDAVGMEAHGSPIAEPRADRGGIPA